MNHQLGAVQAHGKIGPGYTAGKDRAGRIPVSYTHLRAHETVLDIVCRLLLDKKKTPHSNDFSRIQTHTHKMVVTSNWRHIS